MFSREYIGTLLHKFSFVFKNIEAEDTVVLILIVSIFSCNKHAKVTKSGKTC